MFKHFIITEFNIKLETDFFAADKHKRPVLTREWLVNRFQLFETYYLPSLAAQSCKDFRCLIYFDVDTAPEFKDRLAVLQKTYPFFTCLYVTGYADLKQHIDSQVRSLCAPDTRYVLTTHMDNDDALHYLAVEKIQRAFRPRHEYGINLTKGYRYYKNGQDSVLLKNSFINGPFCSFIEDVHKTEKLRTMNLLSHHTFFDNYKVKQIRDGYYWLQTIHKANLINELSGIPTMNKKVLENFALATEDISLTRRMFFNYWRRFLSKPKEWVPFYIRYVIVRKLLKRYSTAC